MIEILSPVLQADFAAEFKELFIKILFPALFVVSAAILYNASNQKKQTVLSVLSSYISAIAITYAMRHVITGYVPSDWIPVASGLLALSSEKIIGYMINTFNVEQALKVLFNFLFNMKSKNN